MKRFLFKLSVILWCCATVWVAISFLHAIYSGLYSGPFKDMWWMMPMVERFSTGQGTLNDLLVVHGGAHRLFIPRLFYLMDYGFFSGSNRFLVLASLCAQGVALSLWYWQVRALSLSRSNTLFLCGLVLLVCFSSLQLENMLYTFDTQWFLANSFSLLALYFLVRDLTGDGRAYCIWLSLFLGVCASFCSFLGVCTLLLIVVMKVVYGNSLSVRATRSVLLPVLMVLLYVGWYVSGFESNAYAAVDTVAPDQLGISLGIFIVRLSQWTLIYLGSPLTRENQWLGMLVAAVAIGFVLLQLLALLWPRQRQAHTPQTLFFLLAAGFALAVAVATGIGRLYFINTADEDRYQTINLTFWLASWLLLFARYAHKETIKRVLVMAIAVWSLYVGVYWHSKDTQARLAEFEQVQASALSQAVGVLDYFAIRDTLILGDKARHINRASKHAEFLRHSGWGAYALPEAKAYGLPVKTTHAEQRCAVRPVQLERLADGQWKLVLTVDSEQVDRLWFTDQAGLLRGAATPLRWQFADFEDVFLLSPPVVQWLGYANLGPMAGNSLKALMFHGSQLTCEAVILLP